MANPECCKAGLRTISPELKATELRMSVNRALIGMAFSAQTHLQEDSQMPIGDLTSRLAEDWHFIQRVQGGEKELVWGPAAKRTPQEQRAFKVADTGLSTERLALAVATCATRDCANFAACIEPSEKAGWEHAPVPVQLRT